MIIDFHTHGFEDRHAGRIMADMARRAAIPAYADGTVAGLVGAMDAAGVAVAVVSRITPTPAQVEPVNRWLAGLQGPRLRAAAAMHPALPDLGERVEALAQGGFGGLKLHPDYLGVPVEDPRMFPIYEAARDAGLWVLFHAGLDRGLPGAAVRSTPAGLLRVHRAFPHLRIVAAHLGGEDLYGETETHLAGREVFLDTSFVLRKMPVAALARLVARHGTDHIVFGTDSPWGDPARDIEFLDALPFLAARDKEQILFANAAGLLGLGGRNGCAPGAGAGAA